MVGVGKMPDLIRLSQSVLSLVAVNTGRVVLDMGRGLILEIGEVSGGRVNSLEES